MSTVQCGDLKEPPCPDPAGCKCRAGTRTWMQSFLNCKWLSGESHIANMEALFENQGNPWEENIK